MIGLSFVYDSNRDYSDRNIMVGENAKKRVCTNFH
jgi:hypothetical protein